ALPESPQPGGVDSPAPAAAAAGASSDGTLAERVEAFERETLLAELKRHHHHMTKAAKALGLERSHLYKKCQQLGIDLRAIRHVD
ncbi:MAG: helix-turn-helix domain-containing protein, partial [Candidatus Acidiferrales bacterium]